MTVDVLRDQSVSDAVFEFQLVACLSLAGLVLSTALILASPAIAAAFLLLAG